VAATSSANAWAVGSGRSGTLIEHWDGRAWKIQRSPKLRSGRLLGVSATSSRNAWAVGYSQVGNRTLIEHWNGRGWKVQANPSPPVSGGFSPTGAQLSGVAATSATNAWAVGYTYAFGPGSGNEFSQTIIEHWNGTDWKVQASANPGVANGDGTSQLSGVTATSPTNVWAVGGNLRSAMIQHRKGGAWIAQPSPVGDLFGVAAESPTNIWAVGSYFDFKTASEVQILAVHCR
jgi:hypothetical protein